VAFFLTNGSDADVGNPRGVLESSFQSSDWNRLLLIAAVHIEFLSLKSAEGEMIAG
jgi:hypothetical protein